MLERKPSLTDQAKAYIKERILNNEFEGERIPSETDLATELGVSRTTVRDALSRLESEGVVYRKQGAGTFVNRAGLQIRTRLDEIWSYEAVLKAHGYTPSTRIVSATEAAADAELAAELAIDPDSPVLSIKKLFLEDDEPVIFTHNQIPAPLISRKYTERALRLPVYDFLWRYGRQHLNHYLSEIVPVVAKANLAETLHIAEGTPLLSFVELGFNDENDPILKSQSFIRDDLLRLRLVRRRS